MPPVNGFWSLTMYGAAYFFVPNPLNSYTLSSRNKFVSNPDGSVDLYLQATRRARRRKSIGCLLPTLVSFLCGACTGPKETPPSIMDGTCKPPARERGPIDSVNPAVLAVSWAVQNGQALGGVRAKGNTALDPATGLRHLSASGCTISAVAFLLRDGAVVPGFGITLRHRCRRKKA